MDRFKAMQVFNRVVEAGSFSGAATSLNLPRSSVTAAVQQLERRLDTCLLIRTTRKLSVTHEGREFYDRSVRILSELNDLEALFTSISHTPKGRLRIDMPASIGRPLLIPQLQDFKARYPDLELIIGLNDRRVDLVAEGVDCVIRIGELDDSSLIARRIGFGRRVICASPDYLSQYGQPQRLEDLPNHQSVNYISWRTARVFPWEFMVDNKVVRKDLPGSISVDDSSAYISCGLQGFGLIAPMRFLVRSHLESGALVEVLHDWPIRPVLISFLYPPNRHLSPKVRVFTDWAAEILRQASGISSDP